MNPMVEVSILFGLSLLAAFILFKYLKNTANVKLPIGQFGGAAAGFIGVYFMLYSSYNSLEKIKSETKTISLRTPPNFKQFTSEEYKFGFGYPNYLRFVNQLGKWKTIDIGLIEISDSSAIRVQTNKVSITDSKSVSSEEIFRIISSLNKEASKAHFSDYVVDKEEAYSVNGISGLMQYANGTLEGTKVRQILYTIPNANIDLVYNFIYTSTESNYEGGKKIFFETISTFIMN